MVRHLFIRRGKKLKMYGTVILPNKECNYCRFEEDKINPIIQLGEKALPELEANLKKAQTEEEIVENLYIVDRIIENGARGCERLYPVLSKFNNTASPNIQTFLAGIYRKIKIPDAFGPLVAMLIRNAINPPEASFDANEEIGGAILDYLA